MAVADEQSVAVRIEPPRYPWHALPWATLTRDLERLPHALLLHGQNGLGKNDFALRLAQFLLCRQRGADGTACGDCQSCKLFRVGNHPDLLRIAPAEEGKSILVDQVRGVIEFLSLKPHMATHKIVLLSPAEAMNVNAANSLLKVLEEPPAGALLVLVATHLSRVPVTIRSRCSRVMFALPSTPDALNWLSTRSPTGAQPEALLAEAGGAPLEALMLAQQGVAVETGKLAADLRSLAQQRIDPVACAERWKSVGPALCLEWLQRHIANLIRAVSNDKPIDENILSISIIDLFGFLDMVSIARRQLGTGADEALMIENLLIRWSEINA